jgi:MFS transporter, FHS family, glucose/mannose:H+ symporter
MKNTFKISLYLNYFVFSILLSSIGIVILKAQSFYHVNEIQASALEIFKDLSITVFSFASASILPKLGYKNAMLIAIAAVSAACAAMASISALGFWMPKILFATIGASFALIKISVYSSIAVFTSKKEEHKKFMGSIEGIFMVGVAIAYFLFPAFNKEKDPNAWLRVYWLLAALSFLSFLFLLFSKSKKIEMASSRLKEDFSSMFSLAKKPIVVIFILSTFLFVMIEQSIMTWLPTFNQKVLSLDENIAIMSASILAVLIGIGRTSSGYLVKYLPWFNASILCLLVSICLVFMILYQINFATYFQIPWFSYAFPLIGLFIAPLSPLINSNMLAILPKDLQNHMSGLITIFSAMGGVIGSRITGFLFKKMGGSLAFYYLIIPMGLLLISLYFLYKKYKKKNIQFS